jgi:hypothetical protein
VHTTITYFGQYMRASIAPWNLESGHFFCNSKYVKVDTHMYYIDMIDSHDILNS